MSEGPYEAVHHSGVAWTVKPYHVEPRALMVQPRAEDLADDLNSAWLAGAATAAARVEGLERGLEAIANFRGSLGSEKYDHYDDMKAIARAALGEKP